MFRTTRLSCLSVLVTLSIQHTVAQAQTPLDTLLDLYPGLKAYCDGGLLARLYGTPFGTGANAIATADDFVQNHAQIYGIESSELWPQGPAYGNSHTVDLVYDTLTGTYRFTLVSYSQHEGATPVFRAGLRLLVRETTGYPLWLAASTIRDLGTFTVDPALEGTDLQAIVEAFSDPDFPSMSNKGIPRMVVWAGVGRTVETPTVGVSFTGDDGASPPDEEYLYVIDLLNTDSILHKESLVLRADVVGTVHGNATLGTRPDICRETALTALPYAKVVIVDDTTFALANGHYELLDVGDPGDGVLVESPMRGQWFTVQNQALGGAPDDKLDVAVLQPDPVTVDFTHNSSIQEFVTSQVNAYLHANIVRDLALRYNPGYPGLQEVVNIRVNEQGDSWCYAGYHMRWRALRFGQSGYNPYIDRTCPNTAYSSIVYHEYGHHLVAMATGLPGGQYGEGFGDAMSALLTDESGIGYGFYSDCNSPIRDIDTNVQYPCTDADHGEDGKYVCGRILAGGMWHTREHLSHFEPAYRDILACLLINSVFLHVSQEITPAITIDLVTLDDVDGRISNRTPHYRQIYNGFDLHNMIPPGFPPAVPSGGGSCPFLSVYTEHGFVDENTILTQSEYMAPGVAARDFYPIENRPALVDGEYRFRIDERGEEVSYIDDIQLLIVDAEKGLTARITSDGELFFAQRSILPISARDYLGRDVLTEIHAEDSVTYHKNEPGWLVTAYRIPDEVRGDVFAGHSVAAKLPCGPIEKISGHGRDQDPSMERAYGPPIELSMSYRQNGGPWVSLKRPPPRDINTPTFTSTDIVLTPGAEVEVKYEWSHRWVADALPLVVAAEEAPIPREVAAVSAVHSSAGDVSATLVEADDEFSVLHKREYLDLRFPAGRRPPSDKNTYFFLSAKGYYTAFEPGASPTLPAEYALHPSYPNPFNAQVRIDYALPSGSDVTIEIFNVLGQEVRTLVSGEKSAGEHSVIWDGTDNRGAAVASGTYFVRMKAGDFEQKRKMTLLK